MTITSVVKEEQSNTQAIVIPEDKAVELTIVDLTEGEMAISTKTSIETLDEPPNENNNNNTVVGRYKFLLDVVYTCAFSFEN